MLLKFLKRKSTSSSQEIFIEPSLLTHGSRNTNTMAFVGWGHRDEPEVIPASPGLVPRKNLYLHKYDVMW